MFNKFLAAAAAVALTLGVAGCTPDPMVPSPTVAVPGDQSPVDVERAICAQAIENGWTVIDRKPGRVLLRYSPRDFWVNTEVTYDTKTITIAYVDSNNLDYENNGGTVYIHHNYNRWVLNLAHDIQGRLVMQEIH